MERLALMFEIAPRLADAYRLKNEFLAVIHSGSSAVGRQKLADWLLSAEVMELPEFRELHQSLSQLVQRDPQFYGCAVVERFRRRMQQQNKSLKAGLLRNAQFSEFQNQDSLLPYI